MTSQPKTVVEFPASTEVKIDKGIPIPNLRKDGATRWPWRQLEVGDSFLMPRENGEHISITHNRSSGVVQFAKKNGVTLVRRREENGVRLWRSA